MSAEEPRGRLIQRWSWQGGYVALAFEGPTLTPELMSLFEDVTNLVGETCPDNPPTEEPTE